MRPSTRTTAASRAALAAASASTTATPSRRRCVRQSLGHAHGHGCTHRPKRNALARNCAVSGAAPGRSRTRPCPCAQQKGGVHGHSRAEEACEAYMRPCVHAMHARVRACMRACVQGGRMHTTPYMHTPRSAWTRFPTCPRSSAVASTTGGLARWRCCSAATSWPSWGEGLRPSTHPQRCGLAAPSLRHTCAGGWM